MPTISPLEELLEEISTADLSIRQVCLAAGIDPALVSRWKSGRVEPRLSSLERLRQALLDLSREGAA